jgi:hypothetical protein
VSNRSKAVKLFNHLVGCSEERLRHSEAEYLGGRQIDDEVEFGRLLDRNVGRFGTAQNFVDKVAGAAGTSAN